MSRKRFRKSCGVCKILDPDADSHWEGVNDKLKMNLKSLAQVSQLSRPKMPLLCSTNFDLRPFQARILRERTAQSPSCNKENESLLKAFDNTLELSVDSTKTKLNLTTVEPEDQAESGLLKRIKQKISKLENFERMNSEEYQEIKRRFGEGMKELIEVLEKRILLAENEKELLEGRIQESAQNLESFLRGLREDKAEEVKGLIEGGEVEAAVKEIGMEVKDLLMFMKCQARAIERFL